MSNLPEYIFFIGAPGSSWSTISQELEKNPRITCTDQQNFPVFFRNADFCHRGVYFGTGWKADPTLTKENFNQQFNDPSAGTKILKSHEWAYQLDEIYEKFPGQWIMLVYRPSLACFSWWHETGGFQISYPDYKPYYKDSTNMLSEISRMNQAILEFGHKHNASWHPFTRKWALDFFDIHQHIRQVKKDILVTIVKS
jgi:hypothetical protein